MKILYLFVLAFMFTLSSCKDDPPAAPATGDGGLGLPGGGGGTGGNVTFVVDLAQDDQGQIFFEFKPSTGVIVTKISAQCQALNLNDELNDADIPDDVFSSTDPLYVGPITVNLQTGQQWSFNFQGRIGNTQGQQFNVNTNYTIP